MRKVIMCAYNFDELGEKEQAQALGSVYLYRPYYDVVAKRKWSLMMSAESFLDSLGDVLEYEKAYPSDPHIFNWCFTETWERILCSSEPLPRISKGKSDGSAIAERLQSIWTEHTQAIYEDGANVEVLLEVAIECMMTYIDTCLRKEYIEVRSRKFMVDFIREKKLEFTKDGKLFWE